jgi:hypothetical protein
MLRGDWHGDPILDPRLVNMAQHLRYNICIASISQVLRMTMAFVLMDTRIVH